MSDPVEPVVDDTAGPADGDAREDARATIAELRRRVDELTDRWQRTAADLDNFRKRAARDAASRCADERARVATAWLPVLDNLDLALEHAEADPRAIITGVQAVREQALAVLAELGYARRDDVGQRFDPSRHEAVAAVAAPDTPPGSVAAVVRPAYGEGGQQLRPASVVVSTGSTGER